MVLAPNLNAAVLLDVVPKADDAADVSDCTVVAARPKKNVLDTAAGAAVVVAVMFDEPNDRVVAAGLTWF